MDSSHEALDHAALAITPRTTLKRHAERGRHERAEIDAILDEGLICHVAVDVDGAPRMLPTAHVRVGDVVYLHGARANHLLRTLASGAPACLTVTLLDGLVFARCAFSHSMNFRCVVLYGVFTEVLEPAEKRLALAALIEHLAPGRNADTRAPNDAELRSTLVVKLAISEGSAKVRTGPPLDGATELGSAHWAGVLPLRLCAEVPLAAPDQAPDMPVSHAVQARARALAPQALPVYERIEGEACVSTDVTRLRVDVVHRFLADESYWARDLTRPALERALQGSICFGLYEGGQQVGFARVVSDGARFAFLADVFVLSAVRGRGLGKWLVQCVMEHPALAEIHRWLLGTADAHGLYARFGFQPVPDGRFMVRLAAK